MSRIIGTSTVKKHSVLAFACGLLLCGLLSPVQGVYYIDKNATGTPENGENWNQAFRTFTNASAKVSSAEIWVAEGVYSNRTIASMNAGSSNAYYGGFTSGMSDFAQRDWVVHPTILDGQSNAWVVLWKEKVGPFTLDGFTVRNGGPYASGGAAYLLSDGTSTFNNCIFSNNSSTARGGAVLLNKTNCVALFSNCYFVANAAGSDGGGAVRGHTTINRASFWDCTFASNRSSGPGGVLSTKEGEFSFVRCKFVANYSVSVGGAISSAATLTFDDCDFLNNCASNGSGGAISQSGTLVATNCDFVNNITSNGSGGAILSSGQASFSGCNFLTNSCTASGGAISETQPIEILNCTFTKNTAGTGSGGAISTTAQLTSSNCVFANNTAALYGGAIMAGASGVNVYDSDFVMNTTLSGGGGGVARNSSGSNTTNIYKNCSFVANAVTNGANGGGGAILELQVANDTFINCTFLTNTTAHITASTGVGGAIRANVANTVLTITNCIFWGNADSSTADDISANNAAATINLAYSLLNTNAGSVNFNASATKNFGLGIINVVPLFASAVAPYDAHLMSKGGRYDPATSTWVKDAVNSPCIDKGAPASDCSLEPAPNGGLINLGRYGGTLYASKTETASTPKGALILVR